MSKLTNCILNKDSSCVPVWFMRQAGRYLPEFRKIRSQNNNFIKLWLNSNLSSEITLQPIKRFDLDAAIIFSDILMVPYALGQEVVFIKDKGPKLSEFNKDIFFNQEEKEFSLKLQPVYEAIRKTRKKLDKNKPLISFIGSPWTLIIYMLGMKKEKNILHTNILEKEKDQIENIIEKLIYFLCIHIKNQISAGSEVVQIFDSWAGLVPHNNLNNFCYEPNLKIVNFCKKNKIPTICFPRGINNNYIDFIDAVKPECINIDYNVDPMWARENFKNTCIQGGMDPKILLYEDDKIFEAAEKYLKIFRNYPYIFNLGHGMLPETDPNNVKKLVRFVRNYKE